MSRQVVSLVAALCLVVFVVGCSTEAEIERATAGATAATETPDDDVTLVPHEEDDPELSAEDDLEPDPSPPDADADAESQALEPPAEAAPLPLEAEENPATHRSARTGRRRVPTPADALQRLRRSGSPLGAGQDLARRDRGTLHRLGSCAGLRGRTSQPGQSRPRRPSQRGGGLAPRRGQAGSGSAISRFTTLWRGRPAATASPTTVLATWA